MSEEQILRRRVPSERTIKLGSLRSWHRAVTSYLSGKKTLGNIIDRTTQTAEAVGILAPPYKVNTLAGEYLAAYEVAEGEGLTHKTKQETKKFNQRVDQILAGKKTDIAELFGESVKEIVRTEKGLRKGQSFAGPTLPEEVKQKTLNYGLKS